MAFARVEQRNARLASAVKVEVVKGRDGEVAKGVAVYGFQFTCDELDYLDSKSETEARRRCHQE